MQIRSYRFLLLYLTKNFEVSLPISTCVLSRMMSYSIQARFFENSSLSFYNIDSDFEEVWWGDKLKTYSSFPSKFIDNHQEILVYHFTHLTIFILTCNLFTFTILTKLVLTTSVFKLSLLDEIKFIFFSSVIFFSVKSS